MNINKIDTKGWWAVNGTPIYVPSTGTKVEHSNVTGSSTGRDESGVMHIDWVRRDVRKVYLAYKAMTDSELNFMLNLVQGKEFTFKFRDRGSTQTMSAYCGESACSFYSYAIGDEIYTDVTMNIIEI